MLAKLFDGERFIHSVKTAIACILGFLLTKIVSFAADQWIVITIMVVMCAQIYVGSVIQKAYLRFLGTLSGCLVAAFALACFGVNIWVIAATIAFAGFIFSYIATSTENLTYAGTLGAVTTTIIMLGQQPTLFFAFERFLEISIGILIATIISQFVLPIHARTHLRHTQASTLEQLRDYYTACMVTHNMDTETLRYQELDETIIKSLSKQRQLAKEAAREPKEATYNPKQVLQTLFYEKEILRSIDFMHNALMNTKIAAAISQTPLINTFNNAVIQSLNTLIKAIKNNEKMKEKTSIPALNTLKQELEKAISLFSAEELIRLDGFIFSAQTLANCLSTLADLYYLSAASA